MSGSVNSGLIAGFEQKKLPGHNIEIDALVGGSGPPLLLLHGAPQTRVCWRAVAPALSANFTVVVPDLRGYGRSGKPQGGGDFTAYSKRTMALDQIASMHALGFDRFSLAGHDRGGRVAYRLALDHPDAVTRLAVLDIIPTLDVIEAFDSNSASKLWHWTFQAQDAPLPERIIGADPDYFLRALMELHTGDGFSFDPQAMDDYLTCMREPAAIHGMCEDYRSGWAVDGAMDAEDRGRKTIDVPTLVLWGARTAASHSPLSKWKVWTSCLEGEPLQCGHFLPEEASRETTEKLLNFFR